MGVKTYTANQVNTVEKDKISVVRISKANSYQKEFTDKTLITKIINDLKDVKVNKLSPNEDKKVMDNGNVLKKDTTITVELLNERGSSVQSFAVLLSESELYICDVKTMQSSERTVSYLSQSDETTLKAAKELYSLVNAIAK